MLKQVLLLGAACFFALTAARAGEKAGAAHWGYHGTEGPEHWGRLKPEYSICSAGRNQSPVNIAAGVPALLPPIVFHYKEAPLILLHNGHTIQSIYTAGSRISVGADVYELKQFHFHSPSENQILGKSFPLEVHLVHQNKAGELAVIGVMYDYGRADAFIAKLWSDLPAGPKDSEVRGNVLVNAVELLPEQRSYYRYSGSLTTPPCTEGVLWLVLREPRQISREQVERFVALVGENARPVQPPHSRLVISQSAGPDA